MSVQNPSPPALPAPPEPFQVLVSPQGTASPRDVYQAAVNQQRELNQQLDNLKSERRSVSNRLQQSGTLSEVDRQGLESRLRSLDERIAATDKQITAADAQVASAAGIPGAVVRQPPPVRQGPPEEVYMLGGMLTFFVLMPIAIGYARRLWKKGVHTVVTLPAELGERLTRLEQAMDAIAVEIERVGEGQRFVTRLMQEPRALGVGAAEPIDVRAREAIEERRR